MTPAAAASLVLPLRATMERIKADVEHLIACLDAEEANADPGLGGTPWHERLADAMMRKGKQAYIDALEAIIEARDERIQSLTDDNRRLREGLRAIMEIASTKTYCMCEADSTDPHELNCPVSIRLRIHTKADALLAGGGE